MKPNPPTQQTILLVDDAPDSLKMLNAFLQEAGFRIAIAQSGEDALKRAEHTQPDLILLDVLMPGMDGFETCQHLKAQETTREIPVLFMTGLTDTIDKVKGFEIGGVDYLTKPVQPEEVLVRINAHLSIRHLQQQIQKEKERFQRLTEATFEGILIHEKGRILDMNQAAVRMFGFSADELRGKDLLDLLISADREIVVEKIRNQDDRPYESQGVKNDGEIFPLEIQIKTMPVHLAGQEPEIMVTAVRDITWRKQMEQQQFLLQQENLSLRATMRERYKFGEIIGKSQAMQEVYHTMAKAAASKASILICGESGTGKELVARTIHDMSDRQKQAFVPVNCGAVPEALFEREFFGHRKGAFTGADRDKPGYLDRAHKGTLFLDEVGELSTGMQVKLLRALQDGEYIPVGDTFSKTADVRIIAATNRDLTTQLHTGAIRQDFFYRIRVIVVSLPPLRNRREDIPLLIDHFLQQFGANKTCSMLPGPVMTALSTYDWPGNIRELQNELQRYLVEQRLEFIGNIPATSVGTGQGLGLESNLEELSFNEAVEAFEKRLIASALKQNAGHQGKTAEMLHIPPKTLYRKIRKYGLKES